MTDTPRIVLNLAREPLSDGAIKLSIFSFTKESAPIIKSRAESMGISTDDFFARVEDGFEARINFEARMRGQHVDTSRAEHARERLNRDLKNKGLRTMVYGS